MPIDVNPAHFAGDPAFAKLYGQRGAGAPPANGVAPGQLWYDQTNLRQYQWDGIGWIIMSEPPIATFVPQVDQGASTNIAKTINLHQYHRLNGFCEVYFWLTLTAGGTAGSIVTVSQPIGSANSSLSVGSGLVYDANTTIRYVVQVELATGAVIGFGADQDVGAGLWGQDPNLALASGDQIRASYKYRMSSPYS